MSFRQAQDRRARPRPLRWIAPLVALLVTWSAPPAGAANVVAVRVGQHAEFTRIVFELDAPTGYRVARSTAPDGSATIVVTLDAAAKTQTIKSGSALVRAVGVEPVAGQATARIALRQSGLPLKEMILNNPPRIVLDVLGTDTALKKRTQPKVAAKPKPAPTPQAKAKPKVAAKPKPAPTPQAKAKPKAEPAPVKVAKEAPKSARAPKPAPTPAPKAAPAPPKAPPAPAVTRPAPTVKKPEPKIAEPAKPPPPRAAAEATKAAEKPKAEVARPADSAAEPEQAAREAMEARLKAVREAAEARREEAEQARVAREAREIVQAKRREAAESARAKPEPVESEGLPIDPILVGGLAAGLVLLVVLFVVMRRRRSLPKDLDVTMLAGDEGDGPSAVQQAAEQFAMGTDTGPVATADRDLPVASAGAGAGTDAVMGVADREGPPLSAPGLFDEIEKTDEPDKGGSAMDQEMHDTGMDTVQSAPMPSAGDSDVATLMREMERRMAHLESRLEEEVAARERLERQVAAQSEELRVQRAAIARTQRALRGLSRSDEEQATEPALRDPS